MGTGACPAFSQACILAWIHPATARSLLSLYRPQSGAAGSILRLNQCGDSVKARAGDDRTGTVTITSRVVT
jgi:hypothetical protein